MSTQGLGHGDKEEGGRRGAVPPERAVGRHRRGQSKLGMWLSRTMLQSDSKLQDGAGKMIEEVEKDIKLFVQGQAKDCVVHAQKLLQKLLSAEATAWEFVCNKLCPTCRQRDKADGMISNVRRSWELLVFCLACFYPSNPSVKAHLDSLVEETVGKAEDTDPKVLVLAKFMQTHLTKASQLPRREQVPSRKELENLADGKEMAIRVETIDGTYKMFRADSWTLVDDVAAAVASKFNIKNRTPFALYEASAEKIGCRLLPVDARILDVMVNAFCFFLFLLPLLLLLLPLPLLQVNLQSTFLFMYIYGQFPRLWQGPLRPNQYIHIAGIDIHAYCVYAFCHTNTPCRVLSPHRLLFFPVCLVLLLQFLLNLEYLFFLPGPSKTLISHDRRNGTRSQCDSKRVHLESESTVLSEAALMSGAVILQAYLKQPRRSAALHVAGFR